MWITFKGKLAALAAALVGGFSSLQARPGANRAANEWAGRQSWQRVLMTNSLVLGGSWLPQLHKGRGVFSQGRLARASHGM